MENNEMQIVIEQKFDASVEKVWKAITKVEEMRLWFFDNIPDFQTKVGFQTKFNVRSGSRDFIHLWRIIELIPEKKVVYDWQYENVSGEGIVTFELSKQNEQTLLRVINEGLESFPQNIEEFSINSCKAGWEFFIQGRLKTYLESSHS